MLNILHIEGAQDFTTPASVDLSLRLYNLVLYCFWIVRKNGKLRGECKRYICCRNVHITKNNLGDQQVGIPAVLSSSSWKITTY